MEKPAIPVAEGTEAPEAPVVPNDGEGIEATDGGRNDAAAEAPPEETEADPAQPDAAEDGAADGEGDDGEDPSLPPAVQKKIEKRIGRLTARAKAAEAKAEALRTELDEARKASAPLADKASLELARSHGLLPGILSEKEARLVADYESARRSAKYFEEWLEDHDSTDELDLDGKTFTFADIRRARRQWVNRLEEMGDEPADLLRRARQASREIVTLGLAARKAGWKPGARTSVPATPPRPAPPTAPSKAASTPPRPARKAAPDYSGVTDEESLLAAIEATL